MLAYLVALSIMAGIYSLLAISLSLQFGFTGLVNFGLVGFFAFGAYATAILTVAGYPILLGIAAGIVLAAIAAFLIGLLTIRLHAEYLAIVTLGFSEVVRLVAMNESWLTNGSLGIAAIPRPFIDLGTGSAETAFLGIVVACNAIVIVLVRHLLGSPFGRLIRAIRDNEVTVLSLGKSPATTKIKVLVIGGAIAGLAGALYAHYITYVVPDQFLPVLTFYVWMALILGGVGSIRGAVLGAGILILILEGTRFIGDIFPGVFVIEMASVRLAMVGVLLLVFVLYRPEGLFGPKKP